MKRLAVCFIFIIALAVLCSSCESRRSGKAEGGKLTVVTTLFPLYEFARNVGGDKADVALLLPPGMEAHSFEPKPDDVVRINKADLFIYTNRFMEPWAADIIGGLDTRSTLVVNSSKGVRFLNAAATGDGGHDGAEYRHGEGEGMDPHIWLDFDNARIMVDNILAGFVQKDPKNRDYYTANADAYKAKLAELDDKYRTGLAHCEKRLFLHGGHYTFGYLAKRYGLEYESANAVSADSQPTPAKLAELISRIRSNGIRYIYTEELVDPRVAETIARETGAKVLKLHGAHNISRDDLAAGATFISLMERNLKNLRLGLQCR